MQELNERMVDLQADFNEEVREANEQLNEGELTSSEHNSLLNDINNRRQEALNRINRLMDAVNAASSVKEIRGLLTGPAPHVEEEEEEEHAEGEEEEHAEGAEAEGAEEEHAEEPAAEEPAESYSD